MGQTTGRGRRARAWESPQGNLAATLLHIQQGDNAQVATLGFVAGIALQTALDAVSGGKAAFSLKWPNDALVETANGPAKLAGILLESVGLQDGALAVAIGIGVNVVAHPRGTPFLAASLQGAGIEVDARTVFLALSDAWVDVFGRWNGGRGLATIRERWLDHAAGLGRPIAVNHHGGVVSGVFETIDQECRLVIRDMDGQLHHITVGDVHFGDTATARLPAAQD
jgi:BirA family transcriptional regulator, biotin operon repressor / biotin---[acetyl-CoA-carboxylase] ligase